jgi:hypothetical protein
MPEEGSYEKKITIDNIDINTLLNYSDIFDSVQYVKLETGDDNLIGRIDKIIATNDKFIILDMSVAKKVFIFDQYGKFINVAGNTGDGPEEYGNHPNDIAYDEYNDELLVLSHDRKKIMKFKLDGTFVKNIKIDYWAASICVADENSCLVYLNNYTQEDGKINDYNILIINNDGETVSELLPYSKDRTVPFQLTCKTEFCTFQNELLFAPYFRNMIYTIDLDSAKIRNRYCFDFGKHNIPPSLFGSAVTSQEFKKALGGNSHYAYNSSNFIETEFHIVNHFVYQGIIYTGIYSKESGIIKFSAGFINDINWYPPGSFVAQQGNSLVGYVESAGFVALQKQLYPTVTLLEEQTGFLNSIDESDNPVLLIATLKKF